MVTSQTLTELTNQNNAQNNEEYNQGIELDPYGNSTSSVPFHAHNHSHLVNHYHHHHNQHNVHHSPVVIDTNQVYDVNAISSMNGTDSVRRNSYTRGRALIVSNNCDSIQNPTLINCTHHSGSSSSSPSHHHSNVVPYCSNDHTTGYVTDGQVMFMNGQSTMERIMEQEQDQMSVRKTMDGMMEQIHT